MSEKSIAQTNQEILDTLFEIRQMEKQAKDEGPDSIMDLIDRLSRGVAPDKK